MIGIDITFADIQAQITSFVSIPVVVPLVSAILAVGLVGVVLDGLSALFPRD